jgi:protein required for attachment to host cells
VSDEGKPQNPSDDDGRGETEDESNENNRTRVRLQAHGLEVEVESHDASFEEVAEFASEEHEQIRRDALVGEYQQLEERNLHSALLGGE